MKTTLTILAIAAVAYFVLRKNTPPKPAPDDPTEIPVMAAPITSSPKPAAKISYKSLLNRAYLALIECTQRKNDLAEMSEEVAALHALLSSAPQTAERDAALRLCLTIDRAAALTRSFSERANRPSPRSTDEIPGQSAAMIERSKKNGEEIDAFFNKATENQWKAQIAPYQSAARAEWARIPDTAILSGSDLEFYAAAKAHRERIASAKLLYFSVVGVLANGVIARPYEEYAIASSMARIGGGGPVGIGYRPGSKTVFLEGFPNGTEGAVAKVTAYRENSLTYADALNEKRTVERWVFVKMVAE